MAKRNQHTTEHCTGNQQTLQQSTEIDKQYNTVQTATNNVLSLRNVIIGKRCAFIMTVTSRNLQINKQIFK